MTYSNSLSSSTACITIRLSQKESNLLHLPFEEVLQSKLTSLCRMLNQLEQLDAIEALFFLRNCFAIPKLTYVLKAFALFGSPILEQHDSEIQNAEKTLNDQLTTRLWEQSSLPVKLGGLGIRSAKDVALPAFLPSMFSFYTNLPNCFHLVSDNQDFSLLSALS